MSKYEITIDPTLCSGYGACVDAALFADAAKRGPMRGLVADTQHFVHVLVRHLVLEHLFEHAPAVLDEQVAR